ncbi:MAG: serine/threonine-protein kinase [Archangium sp.]|nr:serine/threonine-protein kinase [Archangium sp.]
MSSIPGAKAPTPTMEVPQAPKDVLIGAQVGSYKILKLLGTGGMGSVYLGEHSGIGSRVAIKFLHEHLSSNADLVQRFYAEARAVNVIGHAGIVSIFDMNVLPPNRYYLVMEYLEGNSLESQVGGSMPMTRAVPILVQVCDALDQAHQLGVVHRDLKPENIMLVKRGRQEDFVKILDFGIAKLQSTMSNRKTATGVIIGTPDYMAPEQAGGENIDGRTDQYSLGIIAYELATGRTPFAGLPITAMLVAHLSQDPRSPQSINPAIPTGVSMAIMKALAKRPESRFASCGDFGRALEAALKDSGSNASGVLVQPASTDSAALRATPTPADAALNKMTPSVPGPQSSSPSGPASAAPPRHIASFEVEVKPDQGPTVKLHVQDVSRAGCFLCSTSAPPRVFSRVMLTIPQVGTVQGDVVRHVSAEQAQAWNMPQGFGVQFTSVRPEQREALDMLTKGLPVSPPEPPGAAASATDDRVAEIALGDFRKRIQGDHYVVLGLAQDADVPTVRSKGREVSRQLLELRKRPVSPNQARQIDAAMERVHQAVDVLGVTTKRVEFDGMRSNWKGVAMCLSAGLRVPELEAVRARFLAASPGAEARGRMLLITCNGFENDGKIADALRNCELALGVDPLNLELHHKRHALLKRTPAK